jgi:hypothetical protein
VTTLHLGVLVQPYRTRSRKASAVTTADVAGWLEKRYGLMQKYYDVHGGDVVGPAIEKSLDGALESLLMGGNVDPWGSGMQAIMVDFRRFISSKEAENVGIPNTPTKAAIMGINHRLKKGRGPRRPSFRDTGLYMNSFRAWVT